ncbi:MAG: hypothetical protein ACU843_09870 [Gammaproteobacteria bacterium]
MYASDIKQDRKTFQCSFTGVWIAAATAAISVVFPGPVSARIQCSSNDPTAPCLANVPDILAGQRALPATDDLVARLWLQSTATTPEIDDWILKKEFDKLHRRELRKRPNPPRATGFLMSIPCR